MRAHARASTGIRIEIGQATHPGLDPSKQINEDSCGYAETRFGHLFVVCDGMGGHAGGQQASDIAVRTIFDVTGRAAAGRDAREVLGEAVRTAAAKVYHFGGQASTAHRPGATCVSLLLEQGRLTTAHVGDSRAYLLRGSELVALTRDHSVVRAMLDKGLISEAEARHHPDANRITRALGMTEHVDVEIGGDGVGVYEGDVFILASDGLTDLVDGNDLRDATRQALRDGGTQNACDELVAMANHRGGHDNITVQVVQVVGLPSSGVSTPPRQSPPPGTVGAPVGTTIAEQPAVLQGPPSHDATSERVPTILGGTAHGSESATMLDEPTVVQLPADEPPLSGSAPVPATAPDPGDDGLTSLAAPARSREVATTAPDETPLQHGALRNGAAVGSHALDAPTRAAAPAHLAMGSAQVAYDGAEPSGSSSQRVAMPDPRPLATTAPDLVGEAHRPAPTIIDEGLAAAGSSRGDKAATDSGPTTQRPMAAPHGHGHGHGHAHGQSGHAGSEGPQPGPPVATDGRAPAGRHMYVMMAMAVMIGVLATLLVWALFLR